MMMRINSCRNASQIIVKLITANFNQLQKFNLVVGGDLCTWEYFGLGKNEGETCLYGMSGGFSKMFWY